MRSAAPRASGPSNALELPGGLQLQVPVGDPRSEVVGIGLNDVVAGGGEEGFHLQSVGLRAGSGGGDVDVLGGFSTTAQLPFKGVGRAGDDHLVAGRERSEERRVGKEGRSSGAAEG